MSRCALSTEHIAKKPWLIFVLGRWVQQNASTPVCQWKQNNRVSGVSASTIHDMLSYMLPPKYDLSGNMLMVIE